MKGKGEQGVWFQKHCNSFFTAHQQVLTFGVNSSWFPLTSCKVRSCCLTEEQVFHSFHFEEEARKECAGFQNGAVAIVHIIQQIAM